LRQSIDAYLAAGGQKRVQGRVVAIVTPHAGHMYSGSVAGAAWSLAARLTPRPTTVVMIGPSHYYPMSKPSIWPQGAYDSPLGAVKIDKDLAASLSRKIEAGFRRQVHQREHCLEVQIPFIRRALPQARLVAILTGQPDLPRAREMGKALAKALSGRQALIVVSTDLSHFHNQDQAQILDGRVAQRVEALDPAGLVRLSALGKAEVCGLQALAITMFAAKEMGADKGVVLDMATSARATGDTSKVVGYMAAALVATAASPQSPDKDKASFLEPKHCSALRALARQALEAAVKGRDLPKPPAERLMLQRKYGVFVTLRRGGDLRGCMGLIRPRLPLGQAVVEMTTTAALRDPRFYPVKPEELDEIDLKISLLTPLKPVRPENVQVGRDGLMIKMQGRAGLLLPQVPAEMGWNRIQYLEGLCQKAGLSPNAWKMPQAKLYCFQAQVF
jgi:hypothetical protein